MAVNPTIGGPTAAQTLLAVVVLVLIVVAAGVVALRLRYAGLDTQARETIAAVRGGLTSQTSGTVRIPNREAIGGKRDDIRRSFTASGAVEEVTSLRQATGAVTDALVESYRPLAERLPPRARRLVGLAVLVFVFGALAVSTDAIVALLEADGQVNLALWIRMAFEDSTTVLMRLLDLPVISQIRALLLTAGILLGQFLYEHYWAVGAALLLAATGIVVLNRNENLSSADPDRTLPQPGRVGAVTGAAFVVAWGVVILAIGLGRSVGTQATGLEYGLAAAVLTLIGGVVLLGLVAYRGVQAVREERATMAETPDWPVTAVRLVGLTIAAVGVPLIPVWGVVAVVRLPRLVTAWLAADIGIQVLTVFLGLALLIGAGYAVRSAAGDVRAALGETLSRRSVRWAVGARALPFALVIAAAGTAAAFNLGLPLAVVIGIVAGLVGRLAYRLVERARYRASLYDASEQTASRVIVHGYELDTPVGAVYVARVNGHLLADRDRERLVDTVAEAAADCFEQGDPDPTIAAAFASDIRDHGITDRDETVNRLRERVTREIEGRVAKDAPVDPETVREKLQDEHPAEVWRDVFTHLPHSRESPVHRRRGLLYYG